MATLNLTVTKVFRVNGRCYINWSDGTQNEFGSVAQAREWVKSLQEERETIKKLALWRYFQVDPSGTSPGMIEGRTITVTNEANAMVVIV